MTHMRIRWRICTNERSAYAPPVGAYAFPKIVIFFQKQEKTLKIWMDISIQFLRHPFLSNMNNKIWFYQSSNFLGNRIFLSFKLLKRFLRTHMRHPEYAYAPSGAHMRHLPDCLIRMYYMKHNAGARAPHCKRYHLPYLILRCLVPGPC